MLILAILAQAEPKAAPCPPPELWATLPAPFAVDVPVDVAPVGLVDGGACAGGDWSGALIEAASGDTVLLGELGPGPLLDMGPDHDLDPDTAYTLRFENDAGGEMVETGFTTGASRAVGLEGGPTLESAFVVIARDGRAQVQAEITAAASPDGATVVALALEGRDELLDATLVDGAATVQLTGFTSFAEIPREVCVVARQRDVAGAWADAPSDCVAPDLEPAVEGCDGCGGADRENGTVPVAAAGLLLAGFSRRRRR